MAIFSNQATLTYNGTTTNSNIAYGEILDVLTATKTAIEGIYEPDELVTYVVTLRNTGSAALTGLTLTDDLGGYDFNGTTVYPLTYETGSAALFVNGAPQPAPAVTAGPPMTVTGISIPAGGDTVLVYQARANTFANPAAGGTITNTATVTGQGVTTPVTAEDTVTAQEAFDLTITKSIEPVPVTENGRLTYTLTIRNWGNRPVVATDDVIVTDTFDPILSDLVVTFNGQLWEEGVQYEYAQSTGAFSTNPGRITVPAATFTEDPVTGRWTVTPGEVTLVITGTV